MILLDISISVGIINVGEFKKLKKTRKIIALQVFSTFTSIVLAAFSLLSESKGLKEDFIEYTMLSVKAK